MKQGGVFRPLGKKSSSFYCARSLKVFNGTVTKNIQVFYVHTNNISTLSFWWKTYLVWKVITIKPKSSLFCDQEWLLHRFFNTILQEIIYLDAQTRTGRGWDQTTNEKSIYFVSKNHLDQVSEWMCTVPIATHSKTERKQSKSNWNSGFGIKETIKIKAIPKNRDREKWGRKLEE